MKLFQVDADVPLEGVLMTLALEFEAEHLKDAIDKANELLKEVINKDYETALFRVQEVEVVEEDE